MGGFNPSSPTKRGMEWLPRYKRTVALDAPNRGILFRSKADAVTALANFHPRIERVVGSAPGVALERLTNPFVTPTATRVNPGTDTGATTTGWEDNSNGAANFGDVDDFSPFDGYVRNSSALAATGALKLKFRGNQAPLTAATRVHWIELVARVALRAVSGNASGGVTLDGVLDRGGTEYFAGGVRVPRDGKWHDYVVASWTVDPSTGIPWVATDADNLWDGINDAFGIRVRGQLAAEGFLVAGMCLRVYTTPENRKAYYYSATTPDAGWVELAATSPAAVTAGAYDWWLLYALNGSGQNFLEVNLLGDPDAVETTDPAQTGEHRIAYECVLRNQGSGVASIVDPVGVEMMPLLVDVGSIAAQSQPYADLVVFEAADKIGGVDLDGTGDVISTPDSAGLSITGDIDVQVLVAADDWTPAAQQTLAGKWTTTGNQRSWRLDLTIDGKLRAYGSHDGSTENAFPASDAAVAATAGVADGQGLWVRVTVDVDNGAANSDIKYWYSHDGVTWTQLGATKNFGSTTSFADTTAAVELGAHSAGASQNFTGKVYQARIYSGLTQTDLRAEPVFYADEDFPATIAARLGDTSIADAQSNTWTISNSAGGFDRYGFAQQLTTAAETDYIGVELAVAWADAAQPDAPLVIEARSGTGAGIGDGALLVTAYVFPEDVPTAAGRRVVVPFAGGAATFAASTQYHLRLSSAASPTRGWVLAVADTRSDDIGSGTTLAEIEGASQGGQTDAFVTPTGQVTDRYDLPCCLVAGLAGPSSPVLTVHAAL